MTTPPFPPESLVLRAGSAFAVIHPTAGGRLGQLDLGDGPLLRAPDVDPGWDQWGCFALLPWSNRIPGGHLRFGDIDEQLPVNAGDGSAIHGLVAAVPWTVVTASDDAAELEVSVWVGPYRVRGRQGFRLVDGRLHLTLSVTNEGNGLRWDGPVTNVVVYTGELGWMGVEPVTMPNDGFSLAPEVAVAHGVQLLVPTASLEVRYQFERPASSLI